MSGHGDHRWPPVYVVQRSIARWLGAAGALIAFALLLLTGCMWAWIRNVGQATPVTAVLLGAVAFTAMAGGVCALVARSWAR